jgi:hypothetical protein
LLDDGEKARASRELTKAEVTVAGMAGFA